MMLSPGIQHHVCKCFLTLGQPFFQTSIDDSIVVHTEHQTNKNVETQYCMFGTVGHASDSMSHGM
eukprot:2202910-Amphidinium_carterae.1